MTEEPIQLPVFIVTSTNWTCEVRLNEFNAQFDYQTKCLEAATMAIEAFKGLRDEPRIVMNPDSKNENAFLGTTVLIHAKGSDPENSDIIFSHVCLGNAGFYKDSIKMEEQLVKQLADIKEKQDQEAAREKKLEDDIKKISSLHPRRGRPPKKKD